MRHNAEYTGRYRTALQEYVMTHWTRMNKTDIATAGAKNQGVMTQKARWLRVRNPSRLENNGTKGISINATDTADENIAMESLLPGK